MSTSLGRLSLDSEFSVRNFLPYVQVRLLVDRIAKKQFIRLRIRKPARREMTKPTDGPLLLLFTLKQSNRRTAFSLCQLVIITSQ